MRDVAGDSGAPLIRWALDEDRVAFQNVVRHS